MGKRDKRKKNLTAEDKEKAKAKTEKKDQKAQQKQKKKELNDVGAWRNFCQSLLAREHALV